MSLLPVSESEDFVVHYDLMRGMYRVTVFNDGHFWDEYWFDAYEEKECREHGHWILRVWNNICDITYPYECNKCKTPVRHVTNFCPNCGIIMDREIKKL